MLTDTKIRALKPRAKPWEVADHAVAAPLYLVVNPRGTKSWVLRPTVNGKTRRKTLGRFPDMKISQARETAILMKRELANSPEPVTVLQPKRAGLTVAKAFEAYMAGRGSVGKDGTTLKTADEKWRIYNADIKPTLGHRTLTDVTRLDLANLIEGKAAPIAANRLYSLLKHFFSWCTKGGWSLTQLESSPMERIEKPHGERARERWLDEAEIKLFLKHVDEAGVFANAYRVLLYTGLRLSEPFKATLGDVDGEKLTLLDTKNGLPFVVYLSKTVRGFGFDREGKAGEPVFGVTRGGMRKAGERILKAMQEEAAKAGVGVERWTPHAFRRTMTTNLARFLDEHSRPYVPLETRKKMINHKDASVTGVHYDRWEYWAEKKAGWQRWSDYLDGLQKSLP